MKKLELQFTISEKGTLKESITLQVLQDRGRSVEATKRISSANSTNKGDVELELDSLQVLRDMEKQTETSSTNEGDVELEPGSLRVLPVEKQTDVTVHDVATFI